jgi:NAD(P)-dependent dehydrogenase (short-subunit alcohol dehydrogenase family)
MRFEGKVALVTGGGSGIGEATAMRLAEEGAAVVVNDVNAAGAERVTKAIADRGGKARAAVTTITDKAAVESMVKEAVSAFGSVDVLINNAGINRDALLKKMSEEQWDQVLAVNLKGTFFCAQAAAAAMIAAARGGRIVNTASIGVVGNVGQANYSASKAGVIGLTRTLALELARYGITVNCVAPGGTETQMLAGVPDEIRKGFIEKIPLRRFARPEEIAAVHAFLASDEAAYVTGQTLFVDGGITLGL